MSGLLRTDGTSDQRIVFSFDPGTIIASRNIETPDGINLEGAGFVKPQPARGLWGILMETGA